MNFRPILAHVLRGAFFFNRWLVAASSWPAGSEAASAVRAWHVEVAPQGALQGFPEDVTPRPETFVRSERRGRRRGRPPDAARAAAVLAAAGDGLLAAAQGLLAEEREAQTAGGLPAGADAGRRGPGTLLLQDNASSEQARNDTAPPQNASTTSNKEKKEKEEASKATAGFVILGCGLLVVAGGVAGGVMLWQREQKKRKQAEAGATSKPWQPWTTRPVRGKLSGNGAQPSRASSSGGTHADDPAGVQAMSRLKGSGRGRGKGKGRGATEKPLFAQKQDVQQDVNEAAQLKAAIKIQAMFRGWKARRHVAAGVTKTGPRRLAENQVLQLLIRCDSGDKLPSVNTFGGIDPFVEFRYVGTGEDPLQAPRGGVDTPAAAGTSVQTTIKNDSFKPTWNEMLELTNVVNKKDHYLQIILWDYNMTGNHAVGHMGMTIGKALDSLQFNVEVAEPEMRPHSVKFRNLHEEGQEKKELKNAVIKCKFSYVEILMFKINIQKAGRLPKVDTFGTCDGFIEARILRGQAKSGNFEHTPNEKDCLWSAKTQVAPNDMDPRWNERFAPKVPGYSNLTLQLILWDSNAPMPDTPICHCCVDLLAVAQGRPGAPDAEHKLRFSKLPGINNGFDIKKSTLKITLAYEQVFEQ